MGRASGAKNRAGPAVARDSAGSKWRSPGGRRGSRLALESTGQPKTNGHAARKSIPTTGSKRGRAKRLGAGMKRRHEDDERNAGRPKPLLRAALVLAFLFWLAPSAALAAADLELLPDPFKLVGLTLFFIVLVVVTNALIFKPIFQALDDRAQRVEGARHRAEELEQESDALLQRFETSLREARAEAESKRKNQLGHAREQQLGMAEEARSQAEQGVEEARTQLEAALLTAREGLEANSREIARAVAARVIGREL